MWKWSVALLSLYISKVVAECGGQIIGGFPHNYPGKQECIWTLTSDPGYVVFVSFFDFDLEDEYSRSGQCLNDYILLTVTDREGRRHIGPRYCGKKLPEDLKTMQSTVQVKFVSTYGSQRRGFKLQYEFVPEANVLQPASSYGDPDTRWRRECGGHNAAEEISGEITSPGFPSTYPRNADCFWLLRVPTNKRIYIRIVHLELSSTISECERASLYIVDGYKHNFLSTGSRRWFDQANEVRFCGGHLYYKDEGMKSYLSQGNRIIVRFVTHDLPQADQYLKYEEEGNPIGFKLLWTEVNSLVDEAGSKPCDGFTCSGGEFCLDDGHSICATRTRLCINETLKCNGVANCAENDTSDENNCYSNHIVVTAVGALLLLLIFTAMLALLHRVGMRREIQRRVQERSKALKQQRIAQEPDTSNHQLPDTTPSDFSQPFRRLSSAFFPWSRRTSATPSFTLQETPQTVWQLPVRESPRPPKVRLEAKPIHQRGAPLGFEEIEDRVIKPQKAAETFLRLPHSALV